MKLPTGVVYIKVWYIESAASKLYLLDTNIPENERQEHREITDQLYGGDIHTRMRQEIVLGIGGLRALEAVKLKPTVYPHERRALGVSGHRAHAAADCRSRV